MVEITDLEHRQARKGLEGSNPSLSANLYNAIITSMKLYKKVIIFLVVTFAIIIGITYFLSSTHITPAPVATTTASGTPMMQYSLTDIAKHKDATSCWTAVRGGVYDLTTFIPNHPGGKKILAVCGIDGTSAFTNRHGGQMKPEQELVGLQIGILKK